jgi:hypothetical protein
MEAAYLYTHGQHSSKGLAMAVLGDIYPSMSGRYMYM